MQVSVGGALNQTVGGALAEQVGAARLSVVAGSSTTTIGLDADLTVGGDQQETTTGALTRWGRSTPPIGFGATTPAWAHRRDLDPFDPAAQQVAPPELCAPPLRGDEALLVEGCGQPISCRLPGLPPPRSAWHGAAATSPPRPVSTPCWSTPTPAPSA